MLRIAAVLNIVQFAESLCLQMKLHAHVVQRGCALNQRTESRKINPVCQFLPTMSNRLQYLLYQ